jgi:hypothetical protein
MAQQTAVEWIEHNIQSDMNFMEIMGLIRQAKAMEKEHIMKAFSDGQETPINNPTIPHYSKEEYYNETYTK